MSIAGCRGRIAGVLLALVVPSALLTGCGAGGSGEEGLPGGQWTTGLTVTTLELPAARAGVPYPVVELEVDGHAPSLLEWSLWEGGLPPGLDLDVEGRLHGTPQEAGFYSFTVCVRNDAQAGTRTLAIAVDTFGLAAQSGLTAGEAWSGRPVALRAAGQAGDVTFAFASNESGGLLTAVDAQAGTATYRPGAAFSNVAQDVLRATDTATGRVFELALAVRPDPTATHVAQFGQTDVWYVEVRHKHGTHPFASDLHAALEAVGLRGAGSTDLVGSRADVLAETWIRLEMLRRLNTLYHREPDGGAGAEGFPISFPFEEPGPGYLKPAPGSWMSGAPHHFSVIAVVDGTERGVVGTAFVDDAINRLHENDTSSGDVRLGVFVNVIADYFNVMYDYRDLREDPIDEDDIPALHALLHDLPSPGGRYARLREAGRAFARVLATVVAHEIGHSLGLAHTPRADAHSIMSASASIAPWSQPAFLPEDVERLQLRLPGPGRGATSSYAPGKQGVASASLPEGGVRTCNPRTCNWCLPTVRPSPRPGADSAPAPRSDPPLR